MVLKLKSQTPLVVAKPVQSQNEFDEGKLEIVSSCSTCRIVERSWE